MERIKYFAYYDYADSTDRRNIVLSAVNKIDYIVSCLNAVGYGVDLVSFAGLNGTNWRYSKSRYKSQGINNLKLFSAISAPWLLQPIFRFFFTLNFTFWIIFHCKKGEQIIVYHSLGYAKIFNIAQKLKKFQIIGEIEEIYQDVANNFSPSQKKTEYEFIKNCSKYIFPSMISDQKINSKNKPAIIIHGRYQLVEQCAVKNADGKIHIVYAGTFDPNKGGAQIALESAKYLGSNYHLHLIGFGNKKDLINIQEQISKMTGHIDATVSYDGLLKGSEFEAFLQSCHIGLSTQNPEDTFNDTSFPSKVLTYMANGLKVVSFKIEVLTTSRLNESIYYADEFSSEALANAIMSIDCSDIANSNILNDLDFTFKKDLKTLLLR